MKTCELSVLGGLFVQFLSGSHDQHDVPHGADIDKSNRQSDLRRFCHEEGIRSGVCKRVALGGDPR